MNDDENKKRGEHKIGDVVDDVMADIVARLLKPLPPEELKRRQEQVEADKLERHKERVVELRREWNAPSRHCETTEDLSLAESWKFAKEKIMLRLGTGFLIALVGKRGTGKTQLAVELMKLVTELECSAYYDTATGLLMKFRGAMHRGAEEDLMETMCDYRLLVVDEFGKKSDSDWANGLLYELIDQRYQGKRKDTLLIAPEDNEEKFLKLVGSSVGSRINERGGVIECKWPSFRV